MTSDRRQIFSFSKGRKKWVIKPQNLMLVNNSGKIEGKELNILVVKQKAEMMVTKGWYMLTKNK